MQQLKPLLEPLNRHLDACIKIGERHMVSREETPIRRVDAGGKRNGYLRGRRTIDRGGFSMPVELQLDVYLQALLIFLGKATVYFKAMNKALPQNFQEYIG